MAEPSFAESSLRQARDALAAGDCDTALRIAHALSARGDLRGFELAARALWEMGRREAAVGALSEALRRSPDSAALWHHLGSCLADVGRYDDALAALHRAADGTGAVRAEVLYQIATIHQRRKQYDQAWACLQRVSGEGAPPPAVLADTRACVLIAMSRHAQAVALLSQTLDELSPDNDDAGARQHQPSNEAVARLYARRAEAHWLGSANADAARSDALAALALWPDLGALHILRQLDARTSAGAGHWTLVVQGRVRAADGDDASSRDFCRQVDVVADTPDEALEFIRMLEPPPVRDSLSVREARMLGPSPKLLKGVYRLSDRVFIER
jgi:tetratricopeptide (TPR) repeat protein